MRETEAEKFSQALSAVMTVLLKEQQNKPWHGLQFEFTGEQVRQRLQEKVANLENLSRDKKFAVMANYELNRTNCVLDCLDDEATYVLSADQAIEWFAQPYWLNEPMLRRPGNLGRPPRPDAVLPDGDPPGLEEE